MHHFSYFQAGGVTQVDLRTGADLAHLDELDPHLWMAKSCPTRGLNFDSRTLELLDADGDGRVRAPEVLRATMWVTSMLKHPDLLIDARDGVPLAAIDDSHAEGVALLDHVRRFLEEIGEGDSKYVTLRHADVIAKKYADARFNGDGVIPPSAADDSQAKRVIGEMMECYEPVEDRGHEYGVDQGIIDEFYRAAEAFVAHHDASLERKDVFPLGADTDRAFFALGAVLQKIDDWYHSASLLAYDPASRERLLAGTDTSGLSAEEELEVRPISQVREDGVLDLVDGLNPKWKKAVAELRQATVGPLLGDDVAKLSHEQWEALKDRLDGFHEWLRVAPGQAVHRLGYGRLKEILASDVRSVLDDLVRRDNEVRDVVLAIDDVERLVRYDRYLFKLLNNFVNFKDLYHGNHAIFQTGTLYLDNMSCSLCFPVESYAQHQASARFGRAYLAYAQCTRRGTDETTTICAVITGGDVDHVEVGRNALFYDADGRDWDATIIATEEFPINRRQAVLAPFRDALRTVRGLVRLLGAMGGGAADAPSDTRGGIAVVASFALVGGLLAAFGWMLVRLAERIDVLHHPVLAGLILLAVLVPSVGHAFWTLRRRRLGPLLDAEGWAVNGKLRIDAELGGRLTRVGAPPKGAVVRKTSASKA